MMLKMTKETSLFDTYELPFLMLPPSYDDLVLLNKLKMSPISVQYVEADIEIKESTRIIERY